MTSNRTMIVLVIVVFLLGVIAVYTNSKIETAAEDYSAYCSDPNYSFCDEFDGVGMDSSKWQAIITPDYLNNWVQRGDGVISGNLKAATIPAFSDFTYETKFNLGMRGDLVMRYIDDNNYYGFRIISAGTDGSVYGRIIPFEKLNGAVNYFDPIQNTNTNTLITGSDYVLKIVAKGNRFDFYVNSRLLGSWTDTANSLAGGRIGFLSVDAQETWYEYVRIVDDSMSAGSGSFPGKVWRLLTQGAGKSGKTPKGLEQAPGLYEGSNDKKPPLITGIQTRKNDDLSATVSWETDEDSTSIVMFGYEPDNYTKILRGQTENKDNKFKHDVVMEELVPEAKYYYKILSADTADNYSVSDEISYPQE